MPGQSVCCRVVDENLLPTKNSRLAAHRSAIADKSYCAHISPKYRTREKTTRPVEHAGKIRSLMKPSFLQRIDKVPYLLEAIQSCDLYFRVYINRTPKNSPTVGVTRWWAGRDNAILPELTPSHANCLKTRRLPAVGCTLCWASREPTVPLLLS
jgi:hypothetical protein